MQHAMTNRAIGRRVLLTGGCGFIGTYVAEALCRAGAQVWVLDALTYAALPAAQARVAACGASLIPGDVRDGAQVAAAFAVAQPDWVLHLAAESHVDRSIDDAAPFVTTNILGTQVMVDAALAHWTARGRDADFRYLQMSTDEVFGHLHEDDAPFTAASPYAPRSPYAASKAAADHLALAHHHTHGLPVVMVHASNCYGLGQHPEKFMPRLIAAGLAGDAMPVYGDGRNIRDWLWVGDAAAGIVAAIDSGQPGQRYLLGAGNERRNIDIAQLIARHLDELRPAHTPHARLITFVADRPGHDWRYAIDPAATTAALGWRATADFEPTLAQMVAACAQEPS